MEETSFKMKHWERIIQNYEAARRDAALSRTLAMRARDSLGKLSVAATYAETFGVEKANELLGDELEEIRS